MRMTIKADNFPLPSTYPRRTPQLPILAISYHQNKSDSQSSVEPLSTSLTVIHKPTTTNNGKRNASCSHGYAKMGGQYLMSSMTAPSFGRRWSKRFENDIYHPETPIKRRSAWQGRIKNRPGRTTMRFVVHGLNGQTMLLPSNLAESESELQQRQRALYRPYLFKPNPWLAKTISTIELGLLKTRTSSSTGQDPTTFRCLDLGCGAGRDMTYLVSRALNCLQPNRSSPQWTTLGVDSFIGACEKSTTLAMTTLSNSEQEHDDQKKNKYSSRVSTLVAKVDSRTGVLWVDKMQLESTTIPPVILPNIRYYDPDFDQQCIAALESSSSSTHPPSLPPTQLPRRTAPFDLIVMIRFLERNAMSLIVEHWLAPGGFLLLSHFVQDKDLPVYTKPGPHHRLQSKTEARDWLTRLGLKVVMDEISAIEDGRPVSNVLAQKPLT
ncbi:hypothetical protein DFQ27_001604 [Actinomortierella ambigua]|uniref:Uncharacterized protein n=1 Tax=Actinomortierella ambigua TaxID=1343610 RepID=A0A9P6Q9R5_9FUNG|nr:hypothetical protein DFQ27_001604 [Actinomortierella ambigua]